MGKGRGHTGSAKRGAGGSWRASASPCLPPSLGTQARAAPPRCVALEPSSSHTLWTPLPGGEARQHSHPDPVLRGNDHAPHHVGPSCPPVTPLCSPGPAAGLDRAPGSSSTPPHRPGLQGMLSPPEAQALPQNQGPPHDESDIISSDGLNGTPARSPGGLTSRRLPAGAVPPSEDPGPSAPV